VSRAWVQVEEKEKRPIGDGLVVLAGVAKDDDQGDARYLADKILNLRIFPDEDGKLNYSVYDLGGELLVVSQFTLYGDCRKGRRPCFTEAAAPRQALPLFEKLLDFIRESGLHLVTGEFQTMMDVCIINEGPVTILLDSKKAF